jgi:hypothetical protein
MIPHDLDYRAISREVERNLVRQKRRLQLESLAGHVILFVLVLVLAVGFHWLNGVSPFIFMAWLAGLLFHTGAAFVALGRRDRQLREQLLQKALQDAIVQLGRDDLDYRTVMRLSDDGELLVDDDYGEEEKPKREEH